VGHGEQMARVGEHVALRAVEPGRPPVEVLEADVVVRVAAEEIDGHVDVLEPERLAQRPGHDVERHPLGALPGRLGGHGDERVGHSRQFPRRARQAMRALIIHTIGFAAFGAQEPLRESTLTPKAVEEHFTQSLRWLLDGIAQTKAT
jgi:hypothetical protein